MDHDFLDGIDEQFQRLMKQNGNGKPNGRSKSHAHHISLTDQILDQLDGLSQSQKEAVLGYIQSLKQKVEE